MVGSQLEGSPGPHVSGLLGEGPGEGRGLQDWAGRQTVHIHA